MGGQDAQSWSIITILNPPNIFKIPYSFSEESEDSSQCHRTWESSRILSVIHSTVERGRRGRGGGEGGDYLHF